MENIYPSHPLTSRFWRISPPPCSRLTKHEPCGCSVYVDGTLRHFWNERNVGHVTALPVWEYTPACLLSTAQPCRSTFLKKNKLIYVSFWLKLFLQKVMKYFFGGGWEKVG